MKEIISKFLGIFLILFSYLIRHRQIQSISIIALQKLRNNRFNLHLNCALRESEMETVHMFLIAREDVKPVSFWERIEVPSFMLLSCLW